MAGRPPKPDHLKLLEGDPGKRGVSAGRIQPTGIAERPDHIKGHAADAWDRITNAMPPGLYTDADVDVLSAYCVACGTLKTAMYHIEIGGEVIESLSKSSEGNLYASPWVAIQNKQIELIKSLGGVLGLDPATRAKLSAPGGAKSASKFGKLIAQSK